MTTNAGDLVDSSCVGDCRLQENSNNCLLKWVVLCLSCGEAVLRDCSLPHSLGSLDKILGAEQVPGSWSRLSEGLE